LAAILHESKLTLQDIYTSSAIQITEEEIIKCQSTIQAQAQENSTKEKTVVY